MDVRLRCHWVPIVILHWDRRNCWMGKGHLAQRIISPPRKRLNTISLLSHCSSLLCLSNTMFVCCLHAPVQSSDCSEDCSCPSVCISRKMSLFSPIPLLTFIFFVSWSVYPIFNPLPRIFWDIIESLDGKSFSPNNILRCAGKRIPLGSFKGNCIPTVSIAGVPRDGIYTQSFAS